MHNFVLQGLGTTSKDTSRVPLAAKSDAAYDEAGTHTLSKWQKTKVLANFHYICNLKCRGTNLQLEGDEDAWTKRTLKARTTQAPDRRSRQSNNSPCTHQTKVVHMAEMC